MKRYWYFIIPAVIILAVLFVVLIRPAGKEKKDIAQLNDAGVFHLNHNRLDLAIEAFEKALRIDPSYGPALENLGLAYYRQKRYEKAGEYLFRAMKMIPDSPTLHNTIGSLYREKRLYNEALKYYKKSLELDREFLEPLYNLALTYEEMGERHSAIETWQLYLQKAEKNPEEKEYIKIAQEHLGRLTGGVH